MTAIRRHPGHGQAYVHSDFSPGEPTRDPITKNLYRIGQIGPRTEQEWAMSHGRYLAGTGGLGGLNETQPSWDKQFQGSDVRSLESEDDVNGSGIFDTYGRQATVHPNMGVFADNPSIPGYINREVQFAVSKEVSDLPAGADVVIVPGGGMTYMERNRFPVPFDRFAPTPCPPQIQPPPPTAMDRLHAPMPLLPAPNPPPYPMAMGHMPTVVHPRPRPALGHLPTVIHPKQQDMFAPVPFATKQTVVPKAPWNFPAVFDQPIGVPFNPPLVPNQTWRAPLMLQDISRVEMTRRRVPLAPQGLGATEEGPGWGTYLFAGLLVGGSAALFFGATKMKKAR